MAQPDNGLLHGKNPRQLCLSLSAGQGHLLLDVRQRFQILNERLRPVQRQLEKISKSASGAHITTIFIMLNREVEELDGAVDYHAVLWFACRHDVFESIDAAAAANTFANAFCAALKGSAGVVVDDWEVRSHEDITLADLELMKRLDFDFRSEAPKPGGAAPPSPV